MSANVAIGVQDFSTLIENHYFYVDKTAFLKEWWDSGDIYKKSFKFNFQDESGTGTWHYDRYYTGKQGVFFSI